MGGYKGGAVASRLVVENILSCYQHARRDLSPLHVLQDGVRLAHKMLRQKAAEDPDLEKMGSTVVATVVKGNQIYLVNVGDSRAYIINRQGVRQISFDHSFVAEQIRQGLISEAQGRTHPRRNVLTMSISAQRERLEMYSGMFPWQQKEILVLCSDGLWGPVTESQIQSAVLELPPRLAAQKLVDLANQNHGPDNISVIVARYS
jgi:protein phosphatase